MSRIGAFQFTTTIELHVVNGRGDSCPLNDTAGEVEVEVECVLHCDDPEDGVYAEEIEARIVDDTVFELGEEAIDLLDLSVKAGEVFNDTAMVPPKRGERYMDSDGIIWTVAGSGKLEDQATWYVWLERLAPRVSRPGEDGPPMIGRTIEDHVLHCTHVGKSGEPEPLYVQVFEEPPPEGAWRQPGLYTCPTCRFVMHPRGTREHRLPEGPHHHREDEPCPRAAKQETTDGEA